MATFFNQATLSYGGTTVNSNTTEAELLSGLTLTKTAINGTYTRGGSIVYAVTVTNMGNTPTEGLTLTDDLGAYNTPGGVTAVPLTYVGGSIVYYLDGVQQPAPTVTATDGLEISGINIPAGSTATFIYEVVANEFAPIAAGSTITNTAAAIGCGTADELTATATVGVRLEAELAIAKAVCPAVVSGCSDITYTIIIQNLGNAPVNATDNVIVSDVFNPILSDITVTLDGTELVEGISYTYNETTGEFATLNGAISVPAATYTQNPETGEITTTPGVAVLTITGTV